MPTFARAGVRQGDWRSGQEYFSNRTSADIITAISKLRWFFMIARNLGRVAGCARFVGRNDDKAKRLAAQVSVNAPSSSEHTGS